jgi:hypothetical protein
MGVDHTRMHLYCESAVAKKDVFNVAKQAKEKSAEFCRMLTLVHPEIAIFIRQYEDWTERDVV